MLDVPRRLPDIKWKVRLQGKNLVVVCCFHQMALWWQSVLTQSHVIQDWTKRKRNNLISSLVLPFAPLDDKRTSGDCIVVVVVKGLYSRLTSRRPTSSHTLTAV